MPSLTRKESVISVLVYDPETGVERERRFRLRAQSIAKQLQQFEIQEKGRLLGLDEAEESFAKECTLTAACRAYLASLLPVVVWLLSDPADDGGPLTEEEFWNLDSADPDRVIGAQEELTAMEAVLGKAVALQQIAGRRALQRLKADGGK